MYHCDHDSEESRPSAIVALETIRGRPWTARLVRNNNLRQHCHLLSRTFRGADPQTDPIRQPCLRLVKAIADKCNLLTAHHPGEYPLVPVLVRIASYAGRWIRDPEAWTPGVGGTPRRIIRSLLEHLFATWPMPDCFDSAWLVKGELNYLERDWYCHLACGRSLRKVNAMPPSISSRALHLAMTAPGDLTIRQALRWGQVKALGGSAELMAEVLASRMVRDLSNDAIWSRLIEKVIAAKHFKPRNFGLIADTLLEVISKHGWERAEILVNLRLAELLRHCRTFWRTILKMVRVSQPNWQQTDIDCSGIRSALRIHYTEHWPRLNGSQPFQSICHRGDRTIPCRIVELTYQWQLVAESKAMRHCVDSYARQCRLGRSSIFSLRTDESEDGSPTETSHLTIEVNRQSRKIIEVRGKWNQSFAAGRIPLLRKWAHEMKLVI
ncbi:MAG: PcfJ domain-containing protein [Verrucomicrobiota bacterium]